MAELGQVAAVEREHPAARIEGDRRVRGAERLVEEQRVAELAVGGDGVRGAVLAVREDRPVAVDGDRVDAPLEAIRMVGDARDRAKSR